MTNAVETTRAGLLASLLVFALAPSARGQEWSVSLAGQSNELLDVKIMAPGGVDNDDGPILHNVRFSVRYYDAGGNVIANEDYLYLDDQLRALAPHVVYERTFVHGQTGVYRVEGTSLSFAGDESGGAALKLLMAASKTDIGTATTVIGKPRPYVPSLDDYCKGYASAATDQNRFNLSLGCGFQGTRWNGEFGYHFYWCRQARPGEADGEWHARTDMLEACRKR